LKELAPGGKFAVGGFVQETAEKTFNGLMAEMAAIDPESTKDRWILTHGGRTYRQQWETGGMEEMTKDLVRAGIKFSIRRETVTLPDGEEREETIGELLIPGPTPQARSTGTSRSTPPSSARSARGRRPHRRASSPGIKGGRGNGTP
jgi:hypothetical protein